MALVVVLTAAGLFVPSLLRQDTAPAVIATTSVPSRIALSPSATSDPGRYSDGIPTTWQGEPVLRGRAALDAAMASKDETPFLVAFWAGIEEAQSCVAQPLGNSYYGCGWMDNVGDQPGVYSPDLGHALHVDTSSVAPGPVIARVHTHDPKLDGCLPVSVVAACQAFMVGDAIVWSGDSTTAPHPTTVAQAAAAFNVQASPSAHPPCGGQYIPGVPILEFPSGSGSTGAIAIFPSPESLAGAAPEAASTGETDTPPAGRSVCTHWHWLARGNVLIAVQPYAAFGDARTKLNSLPAN